MKIGFLHTADVHVATFDQLMHARLPTAELTHLTRPDLLEQARKHGITHEIRNETQRLVARLAGEAVDLIVCSCSTLGDVAEHCQASMPIWRIDRPLMETAVISGRRLLVAATLQSTLQPTRLLLEHVAQKMGREIELVELFCEGAWSCFEVGDLQGYAQVIAQAILDAPEVDVVVLAQASMAPAAGLCYGLDIPILNSPEAAVEAMVHFFEHKTDC